MSSLRDMIELSNYNNKIGNLARTRGLTVAIVFTLNYDSTPFWVR